MNVVTLNAHFDGQHICLDEPHELMLADRLKITILPDPIEDKGRAFWLSVGEQSLARPGDDEPDYSHYIGVMPPAE